MKTYFGASNRVAEGLINLFHEKLDTPNEFCHKTIERDYDPQHRDEL